MKKVSKKHVIYSSEKLQHSCIASIFCLLKQIFSELNLNCHLIHVTKKVLNIHPYQVSLLLLLHLHLKAEYLLTSRHLQLYVLYAAGVGHEQLEELYHHD